VTFNISPEEVDRIEIEGRTIDEARTESRSVQVTLDSIGRTAGSICAG